MECGSALSPPPERASTLWPPDLLLAVALVLTAAGALLVGVGIWVWGTLALLLAGAVFFVRWEAGRLAARPAVTGAWSRLSAQRARLRARSRGQLELFRARRELAELNAERSRGYHELGRATHAGDTSAADAARALVDDVAARIEAKEIEIAGLVRKIDERVRTVAGQAAPSPTLETPPEPARIPEPYPPPDEGEPPEPARVPEPFPEPTPEPSPGTPPPEPVHPPAPETRRRRPSRAEKS
jgi:hypothetical protein